MVTPHMRSTPTRHGGDLTAIRNAFPQTQQPWIDLSTGINPQAYPIPEIDPRIWQHLPDTQSLGNLYQSAADYYQVDATRITAAPGTQALIQWLPFLRAQQHGAGRIGVVGPTYAEHALCWTRAGHDVTQISAPHIADGNFDVVVLVNPNNPDGRIMPGADLIGMAAQLAARGGWLVLDEAFMDCDPDNSFCPHLNAHLNVIILRSFGKFFGLAGLRLGFALGAPEMVVNISMLIGPWPVSGMACAVGALALRDHAWITHTRARLSHAVETRDAILAQRGLHIIGSHPLFSLLDTPYADQLFTHLAQHGIYVRRFDATPHWLRIGALPDDDASAQRLTQCLQNWRRPE